MDIQFIHDLETTLESDLPGLEAQLLMAPAHNEAYREISPDHKIACVLILLFPKNKEWHLCLIERASIHTEDKHAGQLGFPGGQLEDMDDSYEDCALREVYEEIGVAPEAIGILGGLSPLYVHVSNFLIHPYVGFTTEYPSFHKQDSEVASILEVPVKFFLKEKNKLIADIHARGIVLKDTPYYDIQGHKLWGATAMIISELAHIIAEIEDEI
jgi:8-oxo-dGTP pyrophosphatase MutT (NUDIX family)